MDIRHDPGACFHTYVQEDIHFRHCDNRVMSLTDVTVRLLTAFAIPVPRYEHLITSRGTTVSTDGARVELGNMARERCG